MALNRVTYPTSPTPVSGDWELIVELMLANFLENQNARKIDWTNSNIYKGAVFNIQGVIYLADSDTAISGTASNYIMIVPDGETASAEFVTDLTDAAWDSVYNGYFDTSGNFYEFYEGTAETDGEITEARKAFHEKGSDINTEGAAIRTNLGRIYTFGGRIYTGAGSVFLEGGSLFTGAGDIDNGTGHLIPCTSPTSSSVTLSTSYYYIPAGSYVLAADTTGGYTFTIEVYISSGWRTLISDTVDGGITVFSDGSSIRAIANSDTQIDLYLLKY